MLKLSPRWIEHLQVQPETGMGHQVVTVTLKDGREFPQAVVDSGHLTRIRGFACIPFRENDIAQINVTHDKWDWRAESQR